MPVRVAISGAAVGAMVGAMVGANIIGTGEHLRLVGAGATASRTACTGATAGTGRARSARSTRNTCSTCGVGRATTGTGVGPGIAALLRSKCRAASLSGSVAAFAQAAELLHVGAREIALRRAGRGATGSTRARLSRPPVNRAAVPVAQGLAVAAPDDVAVVAGLIASIHGYRQ